MGPMVSLMISPPRQATPDVSGQSRIHRYSDTPFTSGGPDQGSRWSDHVWEYPAASATFPRHRQGQNCTSSLWNYPPRVPVSAIEVGKVQAHSCSWQWALPVCHHIFGGKSYSNVNGLLRRRRIGRLEEMCEDRVGELPPTYLGRGSVALEQASSRPRARVSEGSGPLSKHRRIGWWP